MDQSSSSLLERLYLTQAPRLRRLFLRRADQAEANDLTQETFSRFAGSLAANDVPIAHPEAYLVRIAGNLLRNLSVRTLRRSTNLHVCSDQVPLATPDPHEGLEARDMLRRLERAMLRLNPKTREIFLAHRVDGYTYSEIAARTGLSVKGVESQMSRAIASLDRILGER